MGESPKFTYIRDLGPAMRNVNIQFIVLDTSGPRKTKDGHDIRTFRVSDKSGSISLAVWDEIGASLQPGDVCRLLNGYVTLHKLCITLNCGRLGEIQKINEFCMAFSENPFMSSVNPEYAKPSESIFQKHPPSSTGGGGGDTDGNGNGTGNGGPESDADSSKDNGNGNESSSGGPVPPPSDAVQQYSASVLRINGTENNTATAKTGRTEGKSYRKDNNSKNGHVTESSTVTKSGHVKESSKKYRYNHDEKPHGERRENRSRIGVV